MQVIQTIADEVAELTVFQRTPPYKLPMLNPAFDHKHRAELRARYPALKNYLRSTFTGFARKFLPHDYLALSPEPRLALLEELWADGTMKCWIGLGARFKL